MCATPGTTAGWATSPRACRLPTCRSSVTTGATSSPGRAWGRCPRGSAPSCTTLSTGHTQPATGCASGRRRTRRGLPGTRCGRSCSRRVWTTSTPTTWPASRPPGGAPGGASDRVDRRAACARVRQCCCLDRDRTPYTMLQMNLCLSGVAGCYGRAAFRRWSRGGAHDRGRGRRGRLPQRGVQRRGGGDRSAYRLPRAIRDRDLPWGAVQGAHRLRQPQLPGTLPRLFAASAGALPERSVSTKPRRTARSLGATEPQPRASGTSSPMTPQRTRH